MSYAITDEQEYPRITPAVRWLIALNVVVYFLQLTLIGPEDMQRWLGYRSGDLPFYWWHALTYMFVHGGFWHLALNMYALWLFGPRLEHEWGAGAFTRYYLLCGLGGWLAHALFFHGSLLVGASAAVYGVMLAYAVRWPHEVLYLFGVLPMRVSWMIGIVAGLSLFMGLMGLMGGDGGSGTAHWAHLGGIVAGWLYLRAPSTRGIERLRQRISQVPELPEEPPRAVPRSLPRPRERGSEIDEILARSKAAAATTKRPPAPQPPPSTLQGSKRADELNVVLDKISEQGLGSLTSDERRLLEEMSRRLRNG